jgi:rhodanese-related sulfurtransferase
MPALLVLALAGQFSALSAAEFDAMDNPAIDMPGYLAVADEAAVHRASRRVSEEEFLALSREPGTVVLDARSKEKYDLLHVRGAINLSFPDITVASLAQALPDPETRVLIYCNNNFSAAEAEFPAKAARASLNLSTYIALYSYGYRNVYELAPLVDIDASRLPFEGTRAGAHRGSINLGALSGSGPP